MNFRPCSLIAIQLVLLLAALPSYAADKIEVQGHRGARGLRPENTLPAFEYALKAGVDTLELDLGVTKDNVLVLSHEPTVSKVLCLGAGGIPLEKDVLIHSLTLAELKTYDCGTLKNPKFPDQVPVPGTAIPTLDELFSLVEASAEPAAKKVQFNIETKIVPRGLDQTPGPEMFVKLFLLTVKKHHMLNRTILQSFDHHTLLIAKKLEPKLRLAPLLNNTWTDMPSVLRATKADIISPNIDWVTEEDVRAVHKMGKKVIPWTANTPADWDYLISLGVDGIISDYPDQLIAHLKGKKRR